MHQFSMYSQRKKGFLLSSLWALFSPVCAAVAENRRLRTLPWKQSVLNLRYNCV